MKDKNNKALFEKIYYMYVKLLFEVGRGFFDNEAEIEDALQEAFIKISMNIHKLSVDSPDEIARTRGYVVAVMRSVCIDMLRKSRKSEDVSIELIENDELEGDSAQEETFDSDDILDTIEEEKLYKLISKLSAEDRNILSMYIVQEMKIKEIAELLSISKEAAKKRIQRIIAKVRKEARKYE